MNILIIEDREYDALELSTKLATVCPEAAVTWLSSPQRALEELTHSDATPYDVIFVDQHISGSLGTDLVKNFGKTLNRSVTRVVMLTSDGSDRTRARALVSDCDGFLTKPVDLIRLRAFLDGSKCHWEPSDLPRNLDHYWRLLDGPQSNRVASAR